MNITTKRNGPYLTIKLGPHGNTPVLTKGEIVDLHDQLRARLDRWLDEEQV